MPFLTPVQSLLIAVFAAAVVLGAVGQASRFCLQGGLREAVKGESPVRLLTFVGAVGVALFAVALFQWIAGQAFAPARPPSLSPNFAWGRYLVGGLVFGVGMMLARGCPMRLTVRAAQGGVSAGLLLAVMAASAYAFTRTGLFDALVAPWLGATTIDLRGFGRATQGLDALFGLGGLGGRVVLGAGLGLVLVLFVARRLPPARHRLAWVAAAVIGLLVAAGYGLTSGTLGQAAIEEASFMEQPVEGLGVQSLTFAGPLSDTVHFALRPGQPTFSIGVVLLLGTLVGSLGSALLRGEFQVQRLPAPALLARQAAGAVLAGAGAVIGLGCTVGHGLSGLAVLSLGSLLAMAATLAGALLVLRLEAVLPGQVAPATGLRAGVPGQ